MIPVCHLSALPRGEALRVDVERPIAVFHTEDVEVYAVDDTCTHDVRIQFAGHAAEADSVTVEEGSVEGRDVLAVYSRGDIPVGVLGMNQSRLFGRWRRQLNSAVMA